MNKKLEEIFNNFIKEDKLLLEDSDSSIDYDQVSIDDDVYVNKPLSIDSFDGKINVEFDDDSSVTSFGNLSFFIEYLKTSNLFDSLVQDFPLSYISNNSSKPRDIVGTLMLLILCGHKRYDHITALRNDKVNPSLLGMSKICSEDSIRRALKI